MHAMQYEITLPADYDMAIVRHRVAARGRLLDAFPGLGLKAYCIRERGVDGSPVNQYAPFYLWNSLAGMNRFLWGGGFGGIREDFGRPPVQHWTGLAHERGRAVAAVPRAAVRRTERLPADADPAAAVERALGLLRESADAPGLHSASLAVDTRHWELLHFTLWADTAATPAGPAGGGAREQRYQVLHLSAPEPELIPTGRHW